MPEGRISGKLDARAEEARNWGKRRLAGEMTLKVKKGYMLWEGSRKEEQESRSGNKVSEGSGTE